MTMQLDEFLAFVIKHKDELLVLAAVTSAFASLFAAIKGPIYQREMAEKTLDFQRKQAKAALHGAYTQRWVDRFSEKAAELIVSMFHIKLVKLKIPSVGELHRENAQKLLDSAVKTNTLLMEVGIMLEDNALSEAFTQSVADIQFVKTTDADRVMAAQITAGKITQTIIRNRLSDVKIMFE